MFPYSLLEQIGTFQGLEFDYERYVRAIFSTGLVSFDPRTRAEYDQAKKQIIPYVILVHDRKILFYVRGKEAGEQRLISKGSIGFGGHIRQEDDSIFPHDAPKSVEKIYRSALEREVHEELMLECNYSDQIVAVLNDDSELVGRVHFGIVHVWHLEKPAVTRRERQITRLEFLEPADIWRQPVRLEAWSHTCLERVEQIISVGG